MNNILTFDIEDNFTFDELRRKNDWCKYESQVVDNTNIILNMLQRYNVNATFFILGNVAERHPEIVRMISDLHHEIASHGYIHERVIKLGGKGFLEDTLKSKRLLELLSGRRIFGYRAMGFSINTETTWAINVLAELGFNYDSSILSSHFKEQCDCFKTIASGSFLEVSPTSISIAGHDVTFGGGIFFRIMPYQLIRSLIRRENNAGRPVVIYAHAWEFNKHQPKRKVSLLQFLAQSPITFTTHKRIESLLKEFSFTSISNYLGIK